MMSVLVVGHENASGWRRRILSLDHRTVGEERGCRLCQRRRSHCPDCDTVTLVHLSELNLDSGSRTRGGGGMSSSDYNIMFNKEDYDLPSNGMKDNLLEGNYHHQVNRRQANIMAYAFPRKSSAGVSA